MAGPNDSRFFRVNYDAITFKPAADKNGIDFINIPIVQLQEITADFPPSSHSRKSLTASNDVDPSVFSDSSRSGSSGSGSARSNTRKYHACEVRECGNHIQATVEIWWDNEQLRYCIGSNVLRTFEDLDVALVEMTQRMFISMRTKIADGQLISSRREPVSSSVRSGSVGRSSPDQPSSFEITILSLRPWNSPEQHRQFLKLFAPPNAPQELVLSLQSVSHDRAVRSDLKVSRKRKSYSILPEDEAPVRKGRTVDQKDLLAIASKDLKNLKGSQEVSSLVTIAATLTTTNPEVGVNDCAEESPLILAVKNGNLKLAKLLLQNGANCYSRDLEARTPFHHAAIAGNMPLIRLLWEHAVQRGDSKIDPVDVYLRTPLMMAAEGGSFDAVKFFIDNGANPALRDWENETVLHRLIQGGKFDKQIVKYLIEAGCPKEAQSTTGCVPATLAADKSIIYSLPSLDKQYHPFQVMPQHCDALFSTANQRFSQGTIKMDVSFVEQRPEFRYQFNLTIEPETEAFIRTKPLLSWMMTNRCRCKGPCTLEKGCSCMKIANREIEPFTSTGLLRPEYPDTQPIVTCPAMCECSADCPMKSLHNAVSPPMEIFCSEGTTEWKVRAGRDIQAGQFVTFLGGELIHARLRDPKKDHRYQVLTRTLCVDFSRRANCSRFFADSDEPNLRPIVVRDHDPLKPPQLAFFAKEFIPKGEVMSYDKKYGFVVVQTALKDRAFSGFQFDASPT